MSRRPRTTGEFTHPLHAAPRQKRATSLLGPLLTGVTLGLFALGIYALVGPDDALVSTPGSGTVYVGAPIDPVLAQPEVAGLLACMERYRNERGLSSSADAEVMARAQESCSRELRAEIEATLTDGED